MGARIRVERMIDSENDEKVVLELCALDNSMRPPAQITEAPAWERVSVALENAFKNGGFVYLRVLGKSHSFINELCMKSLPGQYRLVVLMKSLAPKTELLEWWEEGDSPFRGFVRFGDDDWDARTVCSDLAFAQATFKELFDYGDMPTGLLQMRSQWDPKP